MKINFHQPIDEITLASSPQISLNSSYSEYVTTETAILGLRHLKGIDRVYTLWEQDMAALALYTLYPTMRVQIAKHLAPLYKDRYDPTPFGERMMKADIIGYCIYRWIYGDNQVLSDQVYTQLLNMYDNDRSIDSKMAVAMGLKTLFPEHWEGLSIARKSAIVGSAYNFLTAVSENEQRYMEKEEGMAVLAIMISLPEVAMSINVDGKLTAFFISQLNDTDLNNEIGEYWVLLLSLTLLQNPELGIEDGNFLLIDAVSKSNSGNIADIPTNLQY